MENTIVEVIKSQDDSMLTVMDKPTFKTIKNNEGLIVDYQNVVVEGWGSTTQKDSYKDNIVQGAFGECLPIFKTNPILLLNHDVDMVIGKVTETLESEKGLYVRAEISNAPDVKDIRFKIVESVLNAFSVGGTFHVRKKAQGREILKVELKEISVCSIPVNRGALFTVKSEENIKESKIEDQTTKILPSKSSELPGNPGTAQNLVRADLEKAEMKSLGALYVVIDGQKKIII